MQKKNLFIIVLLVLIVSFADAQSDISLTKNYFHHIETYYLLDFAITSGTANPDFFSYTLTNGGVEPVRIKIEFEMTADIHSLSNFNNRRLFYAKTRAVTMNPGSLNLTSVDLTQDIEFSDIDTEGIIQGTFKFENSGDDNIGIDELESLQASLLASGGALPAGTYSFNFSVLDENDNIYVTDNEIIQVSNSGSVRITWPGTESLEEIDNYTITSTNPNFQWIVDPYFWDTSCPECGCYIRVAEYKADAGHESLNDALDGDYSILPYNQIGYYKLEPIPVPNSDLFSPASSLMYNESLGGVFTAGGLYVWQVIIKVPTSHGFDEFESEIVVFKIMEEGGSEESQAQQAVDNLIQTVLPQVAGGGQADEIIEQLEGFVPSGQLEINGQIVSPDELQNTMNQIQSGLLEVISMTIE